MHFYPCTEKDIDLIVAVAVQSYIEHYTFLWFDNGVAYMNDSFNANTIRKEMADANTVYFLIKDEDKAVGFLKLNIDCSIEGYPATEVLELERIYLIKEAAGKGLGKKGIDFVKDFAKQKNKKAISLKAMAFSDVVQFYQKQGFSIIKETVLDYPGVKPEYKEMVVMLLSL